MTIRNLAFVPVAAALLSLSAASQVSRNVTLLSRVHPSLAYNDCWGFVDEPTGREFAILMSQQESFFIETTDPANPVIKARIPGARSIWRDARTYRGYAYIVTEGEGGMQIVDVRNPDAPRLVKTWRGGLNWRNTHNIAIDEENGIAYPCGTSGGMHVLDLSRDPENPRAITRYTYQYVHDLCVQGGYAYLGDTSRSRFQILDVSRLPSLPRLGWDWVPLCHNAWPTRDANYVVTTSETYSEWVRFWDVRNKSATPIELAKWRRGLYDQVPHNAYIRERVCHVSYYAEGYRCLDLTDPSQPLEIGHYDTNAATSDTLGNWGVYCFQPSGVVYASDRQNGLFILKPAATAAHYGDATPAPGGTAPEIYAFGAAYLGNSRFAFEVENANPNSNAYFLVGSARQNVTQLGLTLLVDATIGGVIAGRTDGSGRAMVPAGVPNDPGLDGIQIHVQCLVADPNGFVDSATDGITVDLFSL